MISPLMQFLTENTPTAQREEFTLSERLKDYKFVIRPLSNPEYQEILDQCVKFDSKGKVNMNTKLMGIKLIESACVDPDFRNAEFISASGCMTPMNVINKTLLPGEIQELSNRIQKLSGFTTFDEDVTEAKND